MRVMADPVPSEAEEQGAWGRPVSARLGELVMAAVLLATGLFFVWRAALLPFGRIGLPGPGFFPLVLGFALSGLSIAMLYRTAREAAGPVVYLGHRNVLIVFAALLGLALTFEKADTYLTLGMFAAVLLLLVARAPLWKVALAVVLGMIGVYFAFKVALGVRLPTGEFWDLLTGFTANNAGEQ
jgi:Tripartite tricarboxylate transporter TctB family